VPKSICEELILHERCELFARTEISRLEELCAVVKPVIVRAASQIDDETLLRRYPRPSCQLILHCLRAESRVPWSDGCACLSNVTGMRPPHLAIARFACDTAWHELIGGGATMANAMLDARQEGDSYRRIEVITGQRRRRRWTGEEKARIVAESFEEGTNISEVARRNGVGIR
jgi:Transposase